MEEGNRAKFRWGWIAAVILGVIGLAADVLGISSFLKERWSRIETEQRKGSLRLVNLDAKHAIEHGTARTSGGNLATIQAIVASSGSTPVWFTVDRVSANLGNDECIMDGGGWSVVRVSEGLAVEVNACNIVAEMEDGERREGRIDLVLRYGFDRDNLTEQLRVKGGLAVTAGPGGRFVWAPDGDSALPDGMTPNAAIVQPGQSPLDAVATYQHPTSQR